jgi:hypothetical protein
VKIHLDVSTDGMAHFRTTICRMALKPDRVTPERARVTCRLCLAAMKPRKPAARRHMVKRSDPFAERTRDGLPQNGLTRAQYKDWYAVLTQVAAVATGELPAMRLPSPYPFRSGRHALAEYLQQQASEYNRPSNADADSYQRRQAFGYASGTPGPDRMMRRVERLAPVAKAWAVTYPAPWDDVVDVAACHAILARRVVLEQSCGEVSDDLMLARGYRLGTKTIGRIHRWGEQRAYEYLRTRALVPEAPVKKLTEDDMTPVSDCDLKGWQAIADMLRVSTDTAQRWAKLDGLPVARFKRQAYANTDEVRAWIDERTT